MQKSGKQVHPESWGSLVEAPDLSSRAVKAEGRGLPPLKPHALNVPFCAVSLYSPEEEEERNGEKIYLYMHLKQQPIW